MTLKEEILKNSVNESVRTWLNPWKTTRMFKSIEKTLKELGRDNDIFKKYDIKKARGFFLIYPISENESFKYRVSLTTFRALAQVRARRGERVRQKVRRSMKEKFKFVGKVTSPFHFWKIKDEGFYEVFETLIDSMINDIEDGRVGKVEELRDEADRDRYRAKLRKARTKLIEIKKFDLGDVTVNITVENPIPENYEEAYLGIYEMAMADLEGADLKSDTPETIASTYIRNAKKRGMDEKKIVASLGATFRGAGKEMPADKIASVKAEVKKQLGVESKTEKKSSSKKTTGATLTKKAKEDETYQGTEKVKAAAKRAAETMGEDCKRILVLSGIINEEKACDKKVKPYLSKETEKAEYTCRSCGERFYTEKSLEKHRRGEH